MNDFERGEGCALSVRIKSDEEALRLPVGKTGKGSEEELTLGGYTISGKLASVRESCSTDLLISHKSFWTAEGRDESTRRDILSCSAWRSETHISIHIIIFTKHSRDKYIMDS